MSTTTATTTEWIRNEYCSINSSEHTEYRFEVTGKKITWLRYSGPRNFAFFDFEKALKLFNSFPEATIWMIKVKEYERTYSEYSKKWYCKYYVDGARKMMMRKGLKYMKALQ
jgi:hypothetical protein